MLQARSDPGNHLEAERGDEFVYAPRPSSGLAAAESAEGCEECLATGGQWLHLRICLECGKVGRCEPFAPTVMPGLTRAHQRASA